MNSQAIADVVAPVLAEAGLELDEVEIMPAGKRSVLRIVVDGDGPKGRGPLLDDIARATRVISEILDESDVTGEAPYTLEVTSRGTSRPLTKPQHWRRNTGRLVKLRAHDETFVGRILASDDEGVVLDVDGAERRLAYADIRKPLIQVELNRPADPDLDDVVTDDTDLDDDVADDTEE